MNPPYLCGGQLSLQAGLLYRFQTTVLAYPAGSGRRQNAKLQCEGSGGFPFPQPTGEGRHLFVGIAAR
jgi:hypothetical protein